MLEESMYQPALHNNHRQDCEPSEVQAAQSEAHLGTGVMECCVFHDGEDAEPYVQTRLAGPASRSVRLVPQTTHERSFLSQSSLEVHLDVKDESECSEWRGHESADRKEHIAECLIVDTEEEPDQSPGHVNLVRSEIRSQKSHCLLEQNESERCHGNRLSVLAAVRNSAICWCRDVAVGILSKYPFSWIQT